METDETNTMYDLRVEVAARLRDSLHGKTVDMMQPVKPRVPHMLGLVEIGEVFDPKMIEGTLVDPSHEFWDNYYEEVRTKNKAEDELITCIESLRETEDFRISYPHGEDAGIVYVEVDDPTGDDACDYCKEQFTTTCNNCEGELLTAPSLVLHSGYYHIKASIECPECGYEQSFGRRLIRE